VFLHDDLPGAVIHMQRRTWWNYAMAQTTGVRPGDGPEAHHDGSLHSVLEYPDLAGSTSGSA